MKINDIFECTDGVFPEEALALCQDCKAYITELEPEDGRRRFQIVTVPEPTEEEKTAALQAQYVVMVQAILDNEAKAYGYDSILSVCSYVDTGVSKYDTEGKAFRQWRSEVWEKAFEMLEQIKAGEVAMPTEEELKAYLPELVIDYETKGYTI